MQNVRLKETHLPLQCTNHWRTNGQTEVPPVNQQQTIHVNSSERCFWNQIQLHLYAKRMLCGNLIKYLQQKNTN